MPATRSAPSASSHAFADTVRSFRTASGKSGRLYALPALARPAICRSLRLPTQRFCRCARSAL